MSALKPAHAILQVTRTASEGGDSVVESGQAAIHLGEAGTQSGFVSVRRSEASL